MSSYYLLKRYEDIISVHADSPAGLTEAQTNLDSKIADSLTTAQTNYSGPNFTVSQVDVDANTKAIVIERTLTQTTNGISLTQTYQYTDVVYKIESFTNQ